MTRFSFVNTLFKDKDKDKDNRISVVEFPNVWLTLWALGAVVSHFFESNLSSFIANLSFMSLIIWASLEIVAGRSLFRRLLGAFILVGALFNRI